MLNQYIAEIKKFPPLSREEEIIWIKKAQTGNPRARDYVLSSNLRFVFQIAKKYQGKGLPLEDLIAEGNFGLIKALDRFDLAKEVKFISYAVWWIRQSILSALYTYSNTIRLPLNRLVNVNKICKIKDELQIELQREPTKAELNDAIDDPYLKSDIEHLHTILRLDIPRTESGSANLHEVIESKSWDTDSLTDFRHFEEELKELVENFPKREKKILFMYYGIGYPRTYNLREIGNELNLTRERIRQIKEHTIGKIKDLPEGDELLDYL